MPLIEAKTQDIDENDSLEIDLDSGILKNLTRNKELSIKPLPHFMQQLLKEGGVVNYYKKYKELRV